MNQPGSTVQINPKTQRTSNLGAINNPINVTLTAINADTGKIVWTHFYNNFLFRGGMTVTNGMLIMPGGDGNIHFLDTATGNEITNLHVGASLFVQPTLGLTSENVPQLRMVTIFGGGRWSAAGSLGGGAEVPGGIMTWSLPLAPASGGGATTTVVSTSATTVTASGTGPNGIDPTTFYAVAGIAVIAIIATGALAVTRRKPAS
jgi:hypothetical protein